MYAFNPDTGDVGVIAENFAKPNGIVFSTDYKTVYVTDTGTKSVSVHVYHFKLWSVLFFSVLEDARVIKCLT